MKILYVLDSLGTGGAERSTADLWYFLRDNQVIVEIVVLGHRKEGIEKEILEGGFSVHFVKGRNFLTQCIEISGLIKVMGPDLVHSVLFKSNLRTRLARLVIGFSHIESLVNCTYDPIRFKDPRVSHLALRFYKAVDRITHRFTDHFIAITEIVKQHYQEVLKIPAGKISVIYRGRNANQYADERDTLRKKYCFDFSIPQDSIIVIHVGRQEYQKGHVVLLKALKAMGSGNEKTIVFFLGREGNSSPDIQAFIRNNTLPFQVFWLGHRYDVAQLLAAADIFVFPSLYEGLGGSLIEAQAAGLPIICSDIPVFREVVIDGKNALTFEKGNSETLAVKLAMLLRSRELRATLGAESLANFKRQFILERVNNKMLSFYRELVQ